jgi:hypothetical protein
MAQIIINIPDEQMAGLKDSIETQLELELANNASAIFTLLVEGASSVGILNWENAVDFFNEKVTQKQ